MDYQKLATSMKAVAEPNRMKIINLISCGTLCACDVLEHFDFSQPTLSHHMKILEKAGIVTVTKDSKWHYYALNPEFAAGFLPQVEQLFTDTEQCECKPSQAETIITCQGMGCPTEPVKKNSRGDKQ
jgi:ArsR family transcriptional regulator